jgi:2,3,4,5-tetrahydropyridine-2-carboxylate N-succinyltransferase
MQPFSAQDILNLSSSEQTVFFQKFFDALEHGTITTVEYKDSGWYCHSWIREAILLYIKITSAQSIEGYPYSFDKIPLQHTNSSVRRVPGSLVRRGAYVGPKCVLMPSFINIGAFVGEGTLIDTWSTVGSCAYVGRHCHISGGVGLGGVLEPIQAQPVIIEDRCFIGARCEIAEGVLIGEGSVLASGLCLTQSTRIYNRETGAITFGSIPPYSVVIPGTLSLTDDYAVAAALIVKKRDARTESKVALNEALRDVNATIF